MSKLIIAEKPSVAKSIVSALGASSKADGFYEGNSLLVSWCVGHLVSPMDAGGYDENFKKWRYDDVITLRIIKKNCEQPAPMLTASWGSTTFEITFNAQSRPFKQKKPP